jgi:hypothetical protein
MLLSDFKEDYCGTKTTGTNFCANCGYNICIKGGAYE